jgi:hypothetical protein
MFNENYDCWTYIISYRYFTLDLHSLIFNIIILSIHSIILSLFYHRFSLETIFNVTLFNYFYYLYFYGMMVIFFLVIYFIALDKYKTILCVSLQNFRITLLLTSFYIQISINMYFNVCYMNLTLIIKYNILEKSLDFINIYYC